VFCILDVKVRHPSQVFFALLFSGSTSVGVCKFLIPARLIFAAIQLGSFITGG